MVIQKLTTHSQCTYLVTLGMDEPAFCDWKKIDTWCCETFGEQSGKWCEHGNGWEFREERNAVQFVLTWG